MKITNHSFAWLLLPLVILLLLGASMIYERSGVGYEIRAGSLQYLDPKHVIDASTSEFVHSKSLLLYNSSDFSVVDENFIDNMIRIFEDMRITFETVDVSVENDFEVSDYEIVIMAMLDISVVENEIFELMDWVHEGGKVLFAIRPDPSDTFSAIYRQLGMVSVGEDLTTVEGLTLNGDLLPGAENYEFNTSFLIHSSFPCALEESAIIHAQSADQYQLPIIWSYERGKGEIVFINSDQFITKSSRGIIAASYTLLPDIFAYPVINASVFFIDDFPAPIPQGDNEYIKEQFGRDIQNFMINVWWPDVEALARQYDIYYTAVMIETYNDHVSPPFEKQPEIERHNYFGGLVLNAGGELGLHGYNHVSLCLEEENINSQLGYPGWPDNESMELSVYELSRFAKELFPDNEFSTYVPTSNVLCSTTRNWLPKVLPELRVISSVYLEEEGGLAYEQEFEEAEDGIIELPRIIAGYDITEFMRWTAMNELGLHFINSHFVHPDDVISEDRGASKGWDTLRTQFEAYMEWLYTSVPAIRNMTAREAGMAVQRYDRVRLETTYDGQFYQMELDEFYDEAWFMLRADKEPAGIAGGTLTKLSDTLYLVKAEKPSVAIQIEE